jgi:hypothetical protein
MRRGVEAPTLEVIAKVGRNLEAEFELRPFGKFSVQTAVVGGSLIADAGNERHKLATQLIKERA